MENKKIDRRRVYGIMLDTETANTLEVNGKLDMTCVLPYDFGFAVIDSKGHVYETHSYVNRDIFVYERALMKSAYYADKIPQYVEQLQSGQRIMANTYEIRKVICDLIKEYDCKFICAHNAAFDIRACNNIERWTTKSKYRYFFPKGLEVWDTMRMAQDVICSRPDYKQFCKDNGYVTNNGQVRKTAEVLYRYISRNNDFVEEHTGLEDVLIEAKILEFCVAKHKKMRKVLYS